MYFAYVYAYHIKKTTVFYLHLFVSLTYLYTYKKNIDYIDYEQNLQKIIAFVSTLQIIPTLSIFLIFIFLYKTNLNTKNLLYWIFLIVLTNNVHMHFVYTYNNYIENTNFFNTLLSHSIGAVHPIIIFTALLIQKWIILNKNKYYFGTLSVAIWTGMLWSSNLFGWGGLWSWDPIENISFFYWCCLLYCTHYPTRTRYIITYLLTYDIYLTFLFKINIIESVHIFSSNSFVYNVNNYFILYTGLIVYVTTLFVILKEKKQRVQYNGAIPILIMLVWVLPFVSLHFYSSTYSELQSIVFISIWMTCYLMLLLYIIIITKTKWSLLSINPILMQNCFVSAKKRLSFFILKHLFYFVIIGCFIAYYLETLEYNEKVHEMQSVMSRYNEIYIQNNNYVHHIKSILYNHYHGVRLTIENEENEFRVQKSHYLVHYSTQTLIKKATTTIYEMYTDLKSVYMYTTKLKTTMYMKSYTLNIIIFSFIIYQIFWAKLK